MSRRKRFPIRWWGVSVSFDYEKEVLEPDEDLLKVENLTYKDRFDVMKLDGVSFTVRNKEIVGIAGVEGNGQSELIRIITANLRARSRPGAV